MNIGDWRISQDENGNCVILHKNMNNNEYEKIKTFKIPRKHKISKKTETSKKDKKKCMIQ